MLKKLRRRIRCRLKHGHTCPHVASYHQSPRERAVSDAGSARA